MFFYKINSIVYKTLFKQDYKRQQNKCAYFYHSVACSVGVLLAFYVAMVAMIAASSMLLIPILGLQGDLSQVEGYIDPVWNFLAHFLSGDGLVGLLTVMGSMIGVLLMVLGPIALVAWVCFRVGCVIFKKPLTLLKSWWNKPVNISESRMGRFLSPVLRGFSRVFRLENDRPTTQVDYFLTSVFSVIAVVVLFAVSLGALTGIVFVVMSGLQYIGLPVGDWYSFPHSLLGFVEGKYGPVGFFYYFGFFGVLMVGFIAIGGLILCAVIWAAIKLGRPWIMKAYRSEGVQKVMSRYFEHKEKHCTVISMD
ncbi:hypothetical protein [Neptuniibacter sp. QD37_11]|uniref:hypothetical protein n=1 Tax=Neptuniibacter sp. QD37_11 TaxID=3398209 RepID=UPI0039F5D5A7